MEQRVEEPPSYDDLCALSGFLQGVFGYCRGSAADSHDRSLPTAIAAKVATYHVFCRQDGLDAELEQATPT